MSAALVSQRVQQHGFKDDLESSIYVLLWIVLMCSETSNPVQASLFMKTVLGDMPFGNLGSYTKAHFLIARTFLNEVKFLDRPALDTLVYQLARLFGARYQEEPTFEEKQAADLLRVLATAYPTLTNICHSNAAYDYYDRLSKLENHDATIALFETAISSPNWLDNDLPLKQDFDEVESRAVIKSGWRTSLFMSLDIEPDIGAEIADEAG